MNTEVLMQMERLYMQTAQRVQDKEYPTRSDIRELERMGAFLRAEKRDWLIRRSAA